MINRTLQRAAIAVGVFAVAAAMMNLTAVEVEAQGPPVPPQPLQVSVTVDTLVCASGAMACTQPDALGASTGHTGNAAASSSNHNPVHVVVLVTLNGVPVSNLPASSFAFVPAFAPAGASSPAQCFSSGPSQHCAAAADFAALPNGLYHFYLHPEVAGFNWSVGTYISTLKVTDSSGRQNTVLVSFVIPS